MCSQLGRPLIHENYLVEVHAEFLDILLLPKVSREKLNYKFVPKSNLTGTKKVVELLNKVSKNLIYQISLGFWRQLLVKVEFFDNKIEIEKKSVSNIASN